MSALRWLIPIIVIACLVGCLVGYLAPSVMGKGGLCWGWVRCGVAQGMRTENKPGKVGIVNQPRPILLSTFGPVRHGELLEIVVQTVPGVVCAIRFEDAARHKLTLPVQFVGSNGLCRASVVVPPDAALGEANLLICANICLDEKDRPYLQIQSN